MIIAGALDVRGASELLASRRRAEMNDADANFEDSLFAKISILLEDAPSGECRARPPSKNGMELKAVP